MMTKPAPYPPDTKAKGWRFELDVDRLEQSDTWALAAPDVRPWLLMLWVVSWKQNPCGSLPSDDALIVARLGIAPKVFGKVKPVLMRGWWLADDGRLYHDTIASCVLDMLGKKTAETQRKQAYRERKQAEAKLAEAGKHGFEGNFVPPMSHGTDAGQTWDSGGIDATRTGTRTGTGLGIGTPPSVARVGEEVPDLSHGTDAGRICRAMRQAGIADTNPGNQTLLTLLQAGATEAEFVGAARGAADSAKGFAYALGIVVNERKRAAVLAQQVLHGTLPAAETTYQRSMRERMQEVAPEAARRDPQHPAHAVDFFNAIEVQTRTVEQIR